MDIFKQNFESKQCSSEFSSQICFEEIVFKLSSSQNTKIYFHFFIINNNHNKKIKKLKKIKKKLKRERERETEREQLIN
jgi:hypothetical protein